MVFCSNCGKEVADGVNFCPGCGKPAAGGSQASQPRSVTVGQIKKCPSCGEGIETFQTRCSGCGFEFGTKESSKTITTFSNEIVSLDTQIANEKGNSNETASIAGFVVLNFFTFGIPFVVRTLKRAFVPTVPPLLPTEQKKKSYIENFIVPNNREDILEFALFVSSRIENLLDGGSENQMKTIMWAKTWADKCKQVQARCAVAMGDDVKTSQQVKDLLTQPQLLLKKYKKKAIIQSCIVAALVIGVFAFILLFEF